MPKKSKKAINPADPLTEDQEKFCNSLLFSPQENKKTSNSLYSSLFFKRKRRIHESEYCFSDTLIQRSCKKNPAHLHYEVIDEKSILGSSGDDRTLVFSVKGTFKKVQGKLIYKDRTPKNKENHKERAAKIVEIYATSQIKQLKKEYELAQLATHLEMKFPSFYERKHKNFGCAIMGKMPGEDLFDVIDKDIFGVRRLTTDERIDLCIALLEALDQQVHQKGIVHRDIKPENIRVFFGNGKIIVNIFDFNLSKKSSEKEEKNEKYGTPRYVSPEVIKGKNTNEKSDIFSMGLLIALIWGADQPPRIWEEKDYHLFKTYNFKYLFSTTYDLSPGHQKKVNEIIVQMYSLENEKRPLVSQVVQVFKDIKTERIARKFRP